MSIVVLEESQLRQLVTDAVHQALKSYKEGECYLDIEQAAAYLSTTPTAINRAITSGRLTPDHHGQRGGLKGHRFTKKTLDAFMRFDKP